MFMDPEETPLDVFFLFKYEHSTIKVINVNVINVNIL